MNDFTFKFTKHTSSDKPPTYSFKISTKYSNDTSVRGFLSRCNISQSDYCFYLMNFPMQYAIYGDDLRPFFYNKKHCKETIKYLEGLMVMQVLVGE
jgi:hypothetical protein